MHLSLETFVFAEGDGIRKRRGNTKNKRNSESDGAIQIIEALDTFGSGSGELVATKKNMLNIASLKTTDIGGSVIELIKKFAIRCKGRRQTKTSSYTNCGFCVNRKVMCWLWCGFEMVIFTVAMGEEVGGGGSGGDAVDDLVVQWQGGGIGVNTLNLSKLTRKRTTVECRSRGIILRRDVVDKK